MKTLVLELLALVAIAHGKSVNAQPQKTLQAAVRVDDAAENGGRGPVEAPQIFIVCTGWPALCTASPDCRMNGEKATCDCMRVNETHIVETDAIQDAAAKRLTQAKCTNEHRCDVDQAPVCKAIKYGHYKVDDVKYDWVSTFSYRGWCSLLKLNPKACDQHAMGYTGDLYWAVCDGAPCTEDPNPPDPERPLSCQCRVEDTPFVGANGSCTGENGGIMSSSPLWTWDFQNNAYRIPLPG